MMKIGGNRITNHELIVPDEGIGAMIIESTFIVQ
jgi:hypothetical protein